MPSDALFSIDTLRRGLLCFGVLCGLEVGTGWASDVPSAARQTIDFRRDVHPILSARCFKCHTGKDPSSGVRLDDLDEITGESTGTPLVTVGRSAESRLIELDDGRDKDVRMQPTGDPLPAKQIATLRAWIDQGLVGERRNSRASHGEMRPSKTGGCDAGAPKLCSTCWARMVAACSGFPKR